MQLSPTNRRWSVGDEGGSFLQIKFTYIPIGHNIVVISQATPSRESGGAKWDMRHSRYVTSSQQFVPFYDDGDIKDASIDDQLK